MSPKRPVLNGHLPRGIPHRQRRTGRHRRLQRELHARCSRPHPTAGDRAHLEARPPDLRPQRRQLVGPPLGTVHQLAVAPDGSVVAVGYSDGQRALHDPATLERVSTAALAWTPSGTRLPRGTGPGRSCCSIFPAPATKVAQPAGRPRTPICQRNSAGADLRWRTQRSACRPCWRSEGGRQSAVRHFASSCRWGQPEYRAVIGGIGAIEHRWALLRLRRTASRVD